MPVLKKVPAKATRRVANGNVGSLTDVQKKKFVAEVERKLGGLAGLKVVSLISSNNHANLTLDELWDVMCQELVKDSKAHGEAFAIAACTS